MPHRLRRLTATLSSGRFDKDNKVTERMLAALFGLLFSGSTVAADFLVEVRVLVQRGCMLVNQTRDAGAQALGRIDLGVTARLDGPGAPLSGVLLSQRPPRLQHLLLLQHRLHSQPRLLKKHQLRRSLQFRRPHRLTILMSHRLGIQPMICLQPSPNRLPLLHRHPCLQPAAICPVRPTGPKCRKKYPPKV